MNRRNTWNLSILFLLGIFIARCTSLGNDKSPMKGNTVITKQLKSEVVKVSVKTLGSELFFKEILSTGKSYALKRADIKFDMNDIIQTILVRNGNSVVAGQLLATLDVSALSRKLNTSYESLVRAEIALDDKLIDYGFRLKDSLNVPKDILRMAKIRSGYLTAFNEYNEIKHILTKSELRAPFAGKIADLEAKPFNMPESYRKLCTIIDDRQMQVEFTILESEYKFIAKGTSVEISPFADDVKAVNGIVTQINPTIDANGMIKITALVANPHGILIDGMSVKVKAKQSVPGQLIVPKEAVLQRQDRNVVFTVEDGKAKWNYVEIGYENSKCYTIRSGLQIGQKVIITNNDYLSHDSEVLIQ